MEITFHYVRWTRTIPLAWSDQVAKLGGATRKVLADVSSPVTFSPDGRRLAFVRSSPEEDALMLANSDGTGEQKLAVVKSPQQFNGAWFLVCGCKPAVRRGRRKER